MKKIIFSAVAFAAAAAATPALAATVITSVEIRTLNQVPDQRPIQIAELQLFSNGTNVALSGTATATSTYVNGPAVPDNANDGSLDGTYPNIFHSNAYDGSDVFTLTLSGPTAINRISIYGRTDACCKFRDIYSYTFLYGTDPVGGGTLDARDTSFATAAVPEPATWAMMLLGFGMVGFGLRAARKGKVTTKVAYA